MTQTKLLPTKHQQQKLNLTKKIHRFQKRKKVWHDQNHPQTESQISTDPNHPQ